MSKKGKKYIVRIEDWSFNGNPISYKLVSVATTDSRIKTAIDKDFKRIAHWYACQFDEWKSKPAGSRYISPVVRRFDQNGYFLDDIVYYKVLTKSEVRDLLNRWSEEYDEYSDEYFECYEDNAKKLFKYRYFAED